MFLSSVKKKIKVIFLSFSCSICWPLFFKIIFCSLCYYSCPVFSPFAPLHPVPPLPQAMTPPTVHVRGSRVGVLWPLHVPHCTPIPIVCPTSIWTFPFLHPGLSFLISSESARALLPEWAVEGARLLLLSLSARLRPGPSPPLPVEGQTPQNVLSLGSRVVADAISQHAATLGLGGALVTWD